METTVSPGFEAITDWKRDKPEMPFNEFVRFSLAERAALPLLPDAELLKLSPAEIVLLNSKNYKRLNKLNGDRLYNEKYEKWFGDIKLNEIMTVDPLFLTPNFAGFNADEWDSAQVGASQTAGPIEIWVREGLGEFRVQDGHNRLKDAILSGKDVQVKAVTIS